MAKRENKPKCNFLKLLEGGQNVIFTKVSKKGNERLGLEGLNRNYQKLRGFEREGQNEELKFRGVKVQNLRSHGNGNPTSHFPVAVRPFGTWGSHGQWSRKAKE